MEEQASKTAPPPPEDHAAARTSAMVILAVLGTVIGLYIGRDFLTPVIFAFVFNAIFRPLVRRLEWMRVPTPLGAAIVVLALLAAISGGIYLLSWPMQGWAQSLPDRLEKAEQKFYRLRRPFEQAAGVATQLQKATSATTNPATEPVAAQTAPAEPPAMSRFLGTTSKVVGGFFEILVLLYLLLASGDLFFQKLLKVIPFWQDKIAASKIVDETQAIIFRYLIVNAMINTGQAVVIALILWWLKMPSPILWGVLTVVLEFIPYLGATVMIILLSVTAFATFDSVPHMLAPPAAYLLVTTLQNNIVSPIAYGQKLKLNSVAVLLGVLFWWFVWGIPGAFLAVPIIATIKLISDRTQSWRVVGEFLGE